MRLRKKIDFSNRAFVKLNRIKNKKGNKKQHKDKAEFVSMWILQPVLSRFW